MRTITNDYRDAQILDLGSGYEKGPFLVTQMGVARNDPVPKTKMFVLRPAWAPGVSGDFGVRKFVTDEHISFGDIPEKFDIMASVFTRAAS
jgi:hypothetical protein